MEHAGPSCHGAAASDTSAIAERDQHRVCSPAARTIDFTTVSCVIDASARTNEKAAQAWHDSTQTNESAASASYARAQTNESRASADDVPARSSGLRDLPGWSGSFF
jgi:hypothetical protein